MPDDNYALDQEIIRAAYAERVKDAFKIFAENLGMGEKEQSVKERFARALDMTRKARDLALQAVTGINVVEPLVPPREQNAGRDAPLSAEMQAIVDQATSGTTGHRAVPQPQMGNYRR